jgi:glutamate synthase domain-containing protein 1
MPKPIYDKTAYNPSGCAISGIFSKKGNLIGGKTIIDSIKVMHDRSNGLGGGFAGYGIYPDNKDDYAFHIFYDEVHKPGIQHRTEQYIKDHFDIINLSKIPTRRHPAITNEPLIMRYFLQPDMDRLRQSQLDEKEYIRKCVVRLNSIKYDGAFVFSSGKNMGIFKGVGFPEEIGEFYELEKYSAYCWTAHGRYPTNTPGWWGGAHPFGLLDYSVVHNGEISSYDANKRYIEMFNYQCNLMTDTEVITYMFDYLNRIVGLSLKEVSEVLAAPFWSVIDEMPEKDRARLTYLRKAFDSLLITGPFSILVGFEGGMLALNDRLKLRSMVAATKDDMVYVASEESAIRIIEPDVEQVWAPMGGEPVIALLD